MGRPCASPDAVECGCIGEIVDPVAVTVATGDAQGRPLRGHPSASPVATASVTGCTFSPIQPYPQPHPGTQKDAPLVKGH